MTRVNLIHGLLKSKHLQNKIDARGVTHILIDESSMVERKSQVLLTGFLSKHKDRDIHICFIGDPRQLDPVSENANWLQNVWFDKVKPDFILTKGYRQDLAVSLKVVADLDVDHRSKMICMTNETRNLLNLRRTFLSMEKMPTLHVERQF